MENDNRNWHGHMTGTEAFEKMFGHTGKEYPEEMKREFVMLFDDMHEAMQSLREARHAFAERWKDEIGEQQSRPAYGHPGIFAMFGVLGGTGESDLHRHGGRHGFPPGIFNW